MSDDVAVAFLSIICVGLSVYAIRITVDWNEAAKKLMRLQFANQHARLLGKTVEAKVYEGSKWERMVVVAVSWKGAVAVRPEWDQEAKARWIHKDKAPYRVREIMESGVMEVQHD